MCEFSVLHFTVTLTVLNSYISIWYASWLFRKALLSLPNGYFIIDLV